MSNYEFFTGSQLRTMNKSYPWCGSIVLPYNFNKYKDDEKLFYLKADLSHFCINTGRRYNAIRKK